MFKKYIYTCPDVIHMRKRQKQMIYGSLAANVIIYGGLYAFLSYAEKQQSKKYKNVEVHETETD